MGNVLRCVDGYSFNRKTNDILPLHMVGSGTPSVAFLLCTHLYPSVARAEFFNTPLVVANSRLASGDFVL